MSVPPVHLYPGAPALTRVSLGGSTFARETSDEGAFGLMDHAYQSGITMLDTAATYSSGGSEKVVGAWLASRKPDPAKLTVATKLYPPFTPEAMDQGLTASAERLGVTIDLLYFHKWDAEAETTATLTALESYRKSGRVKSLGVSNYNYEQLKTLLELQEKLGFKKVEILQNNNNLAVRDVDDAMVALCAKHGVAIITYSPLGAGFLTGKHKNGVEKGSRFDVAPGHQPIYFKPEIMQRLDRLEAIATRMNVPMAHLALAWAMHRPGIASVLVGGRGPKYLDQALEALAMDDPALFAELDSI